MNPETTTSTATRANVHRPLGAATVGPNVHAPAVSIGSNATLRTVARVMRMHDIGTIAIVDDRQLAGLLAEVDIARAVADGADPDAALAGAWMSPPVSVHPETRLIDAAITMLHARLRCIPVVGGHGEPLGFVRLAELQLPMLHADDEPGHRLPYMPPD